MILNIPKIYDEYLKHIQVEERKKIEKMPGYYSIGNSGLCFLKQLYKEKGYEPEPFDEKTLRVFRIGTLLHQDIQNAIRHANLNNENLTIEMEIGVTLEKFKARGYFDISVADHESKILEVIDIKTLHSFKWRKLFGQTKNRDKIPSVNNELQLATYTIRQLQKYKGYYPKMYLLYYKKDDSQMKEVEIDSSFLASGLQYWNEFSEFRKTNTIDSIQPGFTFNCPVYKWECNYCQYTKYCNSPYIKK